MMSPIEIEKAFNVKESTIRGKTSGLRLKRRNLNQENQLGLVIIDDCCGHRFEGEELRNIEDVLKANICYLLPYSTSLIQALDLSINYILKSKMRTSWLGWYVRTTKTVKDNSKCPIPSRTDVYKWFGASWNTVSPLTIIKSFLCAGLTNDLTRWDLGA